jgi:hypothetical protein
VDAVHPKFRAFKQVMEGGSLATESRDQKSREHVIGEASSTTVEQ